MMTDRLDEGERMILLDAVRKAIEVRASGRNVEFPSAPVPESLMAKRGVFVSLHKRGELRGCIGYMKADRPLYEAVIDAAISSAFGDPRFPPVEPDEVPHIDIEISVLTPPVPVASWEEIVIGRHGIVLKKGTCHALFLPQVAPERGWDLETTLDNLALKAGLPSGGWREGASFEVFEALVFGESESPLSC